MIKLEGEHTVQRRKIAIIGAGVGLAVVVALYYFFVLATLTVVTVPAGALIKIDGKAIARSPVSRFEIPTGRRQLSISHSYYAPYSEQIDVVYGQRVVKSLDLQLGEGTVKLLSNPKGAWTEVDGQRLAVVTPTEIKMPSGPHEIRMGQAERRAVTKSVELKAGETLSVNLSLNIDPHGTLKLQIKPSGAKVEFVDKQLTYKANMRLPIGEYALKVSKRGYETKEFRYKVKYTKNQHAIVLQRQSAALNISVREKAAMINVTFVDGGNKVTKAYQPNMRVPVGKVQVTVAAMGHRSERKTIAVGAKGASLKFSLPVLNVEVGSVFSDALSSETQGPEMIVLPPGQFQMGKDTGPPSERPAHTVTLTQPFAVSKYEITTVEFLQFVAQTKRGVDARIAKLAPQGPVAHITYKDAVAYAQWLSKQSGESYRLLTESEWEYAAGAGSSDAYAFGNDTLTLCEYANVSDLSAKNVFRTWLVTKCDDGRVRPGVGGHYKANKFGLYDMYGNVAEWVLECGMPDYSRASGIGSDPSPGASCESHGYRGGSWDSTAEEVASSYRNASSRSSDDRGLRVMREF
jgi:formylglycine-generating enzyme required for sulfatase activity|tara:strand:- start:338 stop:2062 length:1725 start_codon:yes stop_codon:yes gene_type:complete